MEEIRKQVEKITERTWKYKIKEIGFVESSITNLSDINSFINNMLQCLFDCGVDIGDEVIGYVEYYIRMAYFAGEMSINETDFCSQTNTFEKTP